jgi:hypothetical protein
MNSSPADPFGTNEEWSTGAVIFVRVDHRPRQIGGTDKKLTGAEHAELNERPETFLGIDETAKRPHRQSRDATWQRNNQVLVAHLQPVLMFGPDSASKPRPAPKRAAVKPQPIGLEPQPCRSGQ